MRLILLNKPFRVLPQFTSPDDRRCLRDYVPLRGVYPAGRLDFDSEGLMVLTDFGPRQARISQPGSGMPKTYLVQVEGEEEVMLQRDELTLRKKGWISFGQPRSAGGDSLEFVCD